jgi:predicted HNH restriction endonuclease
MDAPCVVCGTDYGVEMHHIKALKMGKTVNTFKQVMINLNRKQIPVCDTCHHKIHRGEYDGKSLSSLQKDTQKNNNKTSGEPYAMKVARTVRGGGSEL